MSSTNLSLSKDLIEFDYSLLKKLVILKAHFNPALFTPLFCKNTIESHVCLDVLLVQLEHLAIHDVIWSESWNRACKLKTVDFKGMSFDHLSEEEREKKVEMLSQILKVIGKRLECLSLSKTELK